MNHPPAFQFYVNDWLASTTIALMTAEQERGYLHLLLHQWKDPTCSLPDDDQILSRLSLMNEGWFNGGCGLVRQCFVPDDRQTGRIVNLKLLAVRQRQEEWQLKSSEGGKKSAAMRRDKAPQTRLRKHLTKPPTVVEPPLKANDQPNDQPNGNTSASGLQPSASPKNSVPDRGPDPKPEYEKTGENEEASNDRAVAYFQDVDALREARDRRIDPGDAAVLQGSAFPYLRADLFRIDRVGTFNKALVFLPTWVDWHRQQLGLRNPVMGLTESHLLLTLATALYVSHTPDSEIKKNRPAMFSHMIVHGDFRRVLQFVGDARRQLDAYLSKHPTALKNPTPTPRQ